MRWHAQMNALLSALVIASGGAGCASSAPTFSEGVIEEAMSAGEGAPRDEFGISQGQVDVENRYRSVVLIESGLGRCSGVLVAERLVLTAAHCFCSPASPAATVIDGASCVREAKVTSVFYERSGSSWKSVTDSSRGTVLVHPEFRSELVRRNRKVFVTSRIADLAVVRLGQRLENSTPDGKIRSEEVLLHEEAVVAGFGATGGGPLVGRERRVGRNTVAMLRALDTKGAREIRFLFPGAHTHQGDSGGPCFQEETDVRWLVGINGGYVNSEEAPESWFTSTSSYREWITKQVQEASEATAP